MQEHSTRKFTPRNEGFVCQNCQKQVGPAPKTFRNHCPHCLWSLHVDQNPGDRQNPCKGKMKPQKLITKNGEFVRIEHLCTKCQKTQPNRTSPDDSQETMWKIYENKT